MSDSGRGGVPGQEHAGQEHKRLRAFLNSGIPPQRPNVSSGGSVELPRQNIEDDGMTVRTLLRLAGKDSNDDEVIIPVAYNEGGELVVGAKDMAVAFARGVTQVFWEIQVRCDVENIERVDWPSCDTVFPPMNRQACEAADLSSILLQRMQDADDVNRNKMKADYEKAIALEQAFPDKQAKWFQTADVVASRATLGTSYGGVTADDKSLFIQRVGCYANSFRKVFSKPLDLEDFCQEDLAHSTDKAIRDAACNESPTVELCFGLEVYHQNPVSRKSELFAPPVFDFSSLIQEEGPPVYRSVGGGSRVVMARVGAESIPTTSVHPQGRLQATTPRYTVSVVFAKIPVAVMAAAREAAASASHCSLPLPPSGQQGDPGVNKPPSP